MSFDLDLLQKEQPYYLYGDLPARWEGCALLDSVT